MARAVNRHLVRVEHSQPRNGHSHIASSSQNRPNKRRKTKQSNKRRKKKQSNKRRKRKQPNKNKSGQKRKEPTKRLKFGMDSKRIPKISPAEEAVIKGRKKAATKKKRKAAAAQTKAEKEEKKRLKKQNEELNKFAKRHGGLLMQRGPFRRIVRDVAKKVNNGRQLRFKENALEALHWASECYLIHYFNDCSLLYVSLCISNVKISDILFVSIELNTQTE